jgi:dipeptidyl aminopeptidase/acylaminoacyl peptidase
MVYFFGVGREAGRDPYYRHLYRVDVAGTKIELLTPDIGNHVIAWSPSRRYFIDTWSTPQKPPISVLRTASGGRVVNLQDADTTALVATGWTPPIDIIVKARDGMTDLYGLMHVPPFMTPGRKYPTVIYIQPGPGGGSVGSRSFVAARGDARARVGRSR